jgi:hypothetical protein
MRRLAIFLSLLLALFALRLGMLFLDYKMSTESRFKYIETNKALFEIEQPKHSNNSDKIKYI